MEVKTYVVKAHYRQDVLITVRAKDEESARKLAEYVLEHGDAAAGDAIEGLNGEEDKKALENTEFVDYEFDDWPRDDGHAIDSVAEAKILKD